VIDEDLRLVSDEKAPKRLDKWIREEKQSLFDIVLSENIVANCLNLKEVITDFFQIAPRTWQLLCRSWKQNND
jgi:hypothetical protein